MLQNELSNIVRQLNTVQLNIKLAISRVTTSFILIGLQRDDPYYTPTLFCHPKSQLGH